MKALEEFIMGTLTAVYSLCVLAGGLFVLVKFVQLVLQ